MQLSMSKTDSSLSTRYYAAEVTAWLLAALLVVGRIVGIAPGQPIPVLHIQLADPQSFPRVVALLLLFALLYFYVEWRTSPEEPRRRYWAQIRAVAAAVFGCFALWFSYPLITTGTRFEGISTGWYFASLTLGTLLGFTFTWVFFAIAGIRTRAEAERLNLPRIPGLARFMLICSGLLATVLILASWALNSYAPSAVKLICVTIFVGFFLIVLSNEVAAFYFRQDADGKRIPFARSTAWSRRIHELIEYGDICSTHRPEKQLNLNSTSSPEQVRSAIQAIYAGNTHFHAIGQEELTIQFHPKDGNESNQTPSNWTVSLSTPERKSNTYRVQVTLDDASSPPAEMELPISLMEEHANASLANHVGESPLIPKTLLSNAVNQTILSMMLTKHPLNRIAMSGDDALLRTAIQAGADINGQGEFGWTALMAASAQGYVPIVNLLLESGADPNIANIMGRTPLHFAARYGDTAVCALLIEYHANLNMRDVFGETALMAATRNKYEKIAHLLLDKGANHALTDVAGQSALQLAQNHRLGELAKRLRGMTGNKPS
jgi:uncharacterized protein